MSTAVQGKGFFIWKIPSCEGGSAAAIATQAQIAGFTHVVIKIADGTHPMNYDSARALDLIQPVAVALKSAGIQVWGWHYIYGYDPQGEARKAVQRLQELELDGYVIDAEAEFKQPGKDAAARKYLDVLRAAFPSMPFGLASFRFPTYHPDFPWKAFLERVDYNMPQVYWEQAHNAGTQLARSVRELQALTPSRPVLPIGPGYKAGGWAPTEADTQEFLDTAQSLNIPAVSFFSWDECRRDLPKIWNVVADYSFPGAIPPGEDVAGMLFDALNQQNLDLAVSLYNPNAVQITASRTIQGSAAIRAYYASLLTQLLPGATFSLTALSGSGNSRHYSWMATSPRGVVQNGKDTLGLVDGKITYHYSNFSISPTA